jgi:cyclopropane fatty-acyl-phospholipid synthase-like methyltransferase
MPTSSNAGKKQIRQWISNIEVNKVLDVGCGEGTYPKLLKQQYPILNNAEWWGIEAWAKYIEEFNLTELYNNIINEDVRKVNWDSIPNFDLIIFGDVLEHMTKEESQELVSKAITKSRYIIISIPIVHAPQGAYEGNPFEIHVKDNWSHTEVLESFPYIVESNGSKKIGVYLIRNPLSHMRPTSSTA